MSGGGFVGMQGEGIRMASNIWSFFFFTVCAVEDFHVKNKNFFKYRDT